MSQTFRLDAATEAIAVHMLRHLEWQPRGFSLMFLFADVGPALSLAAWLDARLLLLGHPLQRIETDNRFVAAPEAAVDALVAQLPELSAGEGAVWYGLHRHPADVRWNEARSRFIARINERRYLLERDMDRPLILILPVAARAEVAAMAPDLWHIRSSSHLLRADGQVQGVDPTQAVARQAQYGPANAAVSAYEEWVRLVRTQQPDQIFLPLSQPAIVALLNAGRPADAAEVAQQAYAIAVSRTHGGTPEALRDLSVSLDNVGLVARAQGDWAQAEAVYRESLDLSRQLVERLGGTPEALDDLALVLRTIAAMPGGNPQALTEAAGIYHDLVARFPGVSNYRQRLSIIETEIAANHSSAASGPPASPE
jgi:hypothetical protein